MYYVLASKIKNFDPAAAITRGWNSIFCSSFYAKGQLGFACQNFEFHFHYSFPTLKTYIAIRYLHRKYLFKTVD